MKSQNMTKWMVLAALCVLGLNAGCESEKQLTEDFKIKCELSGGDYKKETNRCACSDESKVHPENIKGECADWLTCMKDNEKRTICENCRFGTSKCENNELYFCNDKYEWEKDPNCVNSCVEKNYGNFKISQCGVCNNDDMQCNTAISDDSKVEQDIVQKCVDGEWQLFEECGQNSCSKPSADNDKAKCGDCKNEDTKCSSKDNISGYNEKCNNGKWEFYKECGLEDVAVSCKEDIETQKKVCGECLNGAMRCWTDNGTNHEIVQTCTDGVYQMSSDCEDASCIPGNASTNPHCGKCKTGTTKCENEADAVNHTQIGYKYTCENGNWSDKVKCESGNSCNADNTDCGVCHNNIDKTCKDDNNIGYMVTCKDGSFENGEKVICPGSTSCKLDTENYELCNQPTGCDCGTNPTNHCLPSQYCTPIQYVCSNEPDENSKQCLTEGGCVCGNINQVCQLNQFCNKVITDKHCVDGLEVKQQPDNWVCGDCQNTVTNKFSPSHCGNDAWSIDCESEIFSSLNSGVFSFCLKNTDIKEIDACFKHAFDSACKLRECKDVTKFENCNIIVQECIKNASGNYDKFKHCSTMDGQLFTYLKPESGVVECKDGPCPCESSENPTGKKCETGQFCYQNKDCINNEDLAIGRLIKCNNPPCEICACNTPDCKCKCGSEQCKPGLVCSGTSNKTCNYVSEMTVFYVSECQDDECSCGDVKCNNGQYCQRDNKGQFKGCIDKTDMNQYVQFYEFKESLGYLCYSSYDKLTKLGITEAQCVNDSISNHLPYDQCFEATFNELESFSALTSYNFDNVCRIKEDGPRKSCSFVCENGIMRPQNYSELCK